MKQARTIWEWCASAHDRNLNCLFDFFRWIWIAYTAINGMNEFLVKSQMGNTINNEINLNNCPPQSIYTRTKSIVDPI